ncbi:LADA_0F10682g1_1 [Lachancea dasiensis]|uniref:LADA_0F10682g1_1 n=1 Tax=Lachancea dasiensis TaxID=1072105 RepID=A0A1G4JM11_9SACH|nr:LADA_0F10682g1_1 [Lachancea dasiensis]
MTTIQQTKPKTVSTTSTRITCEQSQKLVQTMLTMSFGCLSFLRGLFPDDNFVDQRFVPEKVNKDYTKDRSGTQSNSIKIKTLVRGKTLEADMFLDWLEKGVFQSIKLKYLKGLSLGIFADENSPTELLENYVFGFNYGPEGQISVSVNDGDESVSLLDSRKVVQQLMRRFIIITQSLEPLPDKRFLSMRLLFNDSAPSDYQPQLFKDATHDSPATVKVPASTDLDTYSVGSVDTKFHRVFLKVLSVVESNDGDDRPTRDIDPFDLIEESKDMNNNSVLFSQLSRMSPEAMASQTTHYLQDLLASPNGEVAQTQHLDENTIYDCQCRTPCPMSTSRTLNCSSCKRKLHKLCYGNRHHNTVPKCLSCLAHGSNVDFSSAPFKVLMMLRRVFRFMIKKPQIPSKLTGFYHVLVGPQPEPGVVDHINMALSIMFLDETFILEKERRTQVKKSLYLRSSNYVEIDNAGVIVRDIGELLKDTKHVWTFVANSSKAQEGYTSVTIDTLDSFESALHSVKISMSNVVTASQVPPPSDAEISPGSSLDMYSLRIEDDTQNTLETGKRTYPKLGDYLHGKSQSLDDTLDVQALPPQKIRKISASKKTLKSIW